MLIEGVGVNKPRGAAWVKNYMSKVVGSDEAVKIINSGNNIVIQPGCAIPLELVRALVRRKDELENVNVFHVLTVGPLPYAEPQLGFL